MAREGVMTADEFAQRRIELPEGGRWHELHAGQPVLLEAPGDDHGNIVMNLSRELARWFQQRGPGVQCYACHELGLHVARDPDTVYFPAISVFDSGPLFSQTENVIATQVPSLVIDVASSNDRRTDMRLRTAAYAKLGVSVIWVPDPFKKEVQVLQASQCTLALGVWQFLEVETLLPGFRMEVKDVFVQPSWWTSSAPRKPVPPPKGGFESTLFGPKPADPQAN